MEREGVCSQIGEQTPSLNPNINFEECNYCMVTYVSSGIGTHERYCVLNPDRIYGPVEVCGNCGVDISTRAIKQHRRACSGNTEQVLARLDGAEDEKIRKAEQHRDAVLKERDQMVQTCRYCQEPLDKRGNCSIDCDNGNDQDGLETLITIMKSHTGSNATHMNYNEMVEWERKTRYLWSLTPAQFV